jgi:cytochrome oxidase Cu insertion factor (SCO1/SenC/PrrC family)
MSGPIEPVLGTDHPSGNGVAPGDSGSTRTSQQGPVPPVDRAAALAVGTPGIPRRFVYWVLVAAAVLGLGGFLGEHLFSSAGLNPVGGSASGTKARATTTTVRSPAPAPLPTSQVQPVSASLQALMGLTKLTSAAAPHFSLIDQSGQVTSMPTQPPEAVVLTFFDGPCNDICPVLAAEIRQADSDLGAEDQNVEFLTVNTDPLALAQSAQSAAMTGTGLGSLPNWRMLTGPLATLDSVWKSYGVSISVDQKTGLEAHSEVLYFIDASGDLRFKATPFANESTTGTYSLPAATIARWAMGIADYARQIGT